MGMKKSGRQARARQFEDLSNISTLRGGARISRASLLAGASFVALGAFAVPDWAFAACSGKNQTITSPLSPGPIFGKGGNIAVDAGASVAGGPTGVYAKNCGIGALRNRGRIGGAMGVSGAAGGIGVKANAGRTIDLLTNANGATISGGNGGKGIGSPTGGIGGAGGAGVSNAGMITRLTNAGMISGGNGGAGGNGNGFYSGAGGAGGAGGAACRTPGRSPR